MHERDLLGEIVGHRRAVGLVVGGERGPEGRAGQIERAGDELGPLVGHELAQHRDEAVDGVGRPAVRAGQPADRVVGAIHLRVAVDEEQDRARCGRVVGVHGIEAERGVAGDVGILSLAVMLNGRTLRRWRAAGVPRRGGRAAWRPAAGAGFLRQSEYDEDIYLSLDGSATVYVNASLPALVALRGADLDLDPAARFDRDRVAAFFESPGVRVVRVTSSRRQRAPVRARPPRGGRHPEAAGDAGVLVGHDPVRPDGRALPLPRGPGRVGQQAGRERRLGQGPNWSGSGCTCRARSPTTTRRADNLLRGNILAWEQTLSERLAGQPLEMEARMEPTTILYHTLWLFLGSMSAAFTVLALIIWWVVKKGKDRIADGPATPGGSKPGATGE